MPRQRICSIITEQLFAKIRVQQTPEWCVHVIIGLRMHWLGLGSNPYSPHFLYCIQVFTLQAGRSSQTATVSHRCKDARRIAIYLQADYSRSSDRHFESRTFWFSKDYKGLVEIIAKKINKVIGKRSCMCLNTHSGVCWTLICSIWRIFE